MKTYIVNIQEVWIQKVRIEAESEEEAIQLVSEGNGEYLNDGLEFSHSLKDTEAEWYVEVES